MKQALLAITALAVMVLEFACGNGGGSSPTPVTQNVLGTYALLEVDTDTTNIATGAHIFVAETPNSTPPFTGTLKLGLGSWSQTLNSGSGAGNQGVKGTYVFSNSTSYATAAFRNSGGSANGLASAGSFLFDGTSIQNGIFTVVGNTEINLRYSALTEMVGSTNYNVITTYKWNKISDSYQ
jgi:hypothetical protein